MISLILHHHLLIILAMLFFQSQNKTLGNVLSPGMCGGVLYKSSTGLMNSGFCWIDACSYGTQGHVSQFALSFPLFMWFRNPIKNYPWSLNNSGLKTIDDPHRHLSNLAVIVLCCGKEHMGTNWQYIRLNRGNMHAILWKTLQLLQNCPNITKHSARGLIFSWLV